MKMPKHERLNAKRTMALIIIISMCMVAVIPLVFHKTMSWKKGTDEVASGTVDSRTVLEAKKINAEGTIYDRHGNALTYPLEEGDKQMLIKDDYTYAFSPIIGYNSNTHYLSRLRLAQADTLYSVKNKEKDKDHVGGDVYLTIDAELQNYCYNLLSGRIKYPHTDRVNGKNITKVNNDPISGGITVMNADTGEILCMASHVCAEPKLEFNANTIDEKLSEDLLNEVMQSASEGEDAEEPFSKGGAKTIEDFFKARSLNIKDNFDWLSVNNKISWRSSAVLDLNEEALSNEPSGSTMKLFTAIAMLEKDKNTKNWSRPRAEYNNYFTDVYGRSNCLKIPCGDNDNVVVSDSHPYSLPQDLGFNYALKESFNTYFAWGAIQVGDEGMKTVLNRFHFDEANEKQESSFENAISVDFQKQMLWATYCIPKNDYKALADTGYGQGGTRISPLFLTSCMAGIMNQDTVMMKPYMVMATKNDGVAASTEPTTYDGKVTAKELKGYNNKELKELKVIPDDDIKDMLIKTLHDNNANYYELDSGNSKENDYVIAKTGTAQVNSDKNIHIYIIMGFRYKGVNYAICINQEDISSGYAQYRLKGIANTVLGYLREHLEDSADTEAINSRISEENMFDARVISGTKTASAENGKE